MRDYYYLTRLDKSPYIFDLADALYLGAVSELKLYVLITARIRMENPKTGEMVEDSGMFLNVPSPFIGAMEKELPVDQMPAYDFFSRETTDLQQHVKLSYAYVDDRYTGTIPYGTPFRPDPAQYDSINIYPEILGIGRDPVFNLFDLVCWTEDLERLVKRGRIQKRPTKPPQTVTTDSTSQAAPILPVDDETEIKRLQRTVAALALGLAAKGGTYGKAGKPNVSQLERLATEHLRDGQDDRAPPGFGPSTVRKAITDALNACPELKE